MSEQLLTVKQVAKDLQVHPSTVRRMIASGQLQAMRVGLRMWRIFPGFFGCRL